MEVQERERIEIGSFFTLKALPDFFFVFAQKERYEKGDEIASLVDTRRGRQPALGFFGGLEEGMVIRCSHLEEFTDDQVRKLIDSFVKEQKSTEGFASLVNLDHFGILAMNQKNESENIRFYFIFTNKGIITANVSGASTLECKDYDELFSTGLPFGMDLPDTEICDGNIMVKPKKSKSKAISIDDEIDKAIKRVEEALKKSENVLKQKTKADKAARHAHAHLDSDIERNEKELKACEEKRESLQKEKMQAESDIASSGLFAFGRKKDLREKAESLAAEVASEKRKAVRLKRKLEWSKEDLCRELEQAEMLITLDTDFSEWMKYKDTLVEIGHKLEEAKSKCREEGFVWQAPALPAEPACKDKPRKIPMPFNYSRLVISILENASEPLTISEIRAKDDMLRLLDNAAVASIVRGLGTQVEKVPDKREYRFKLAD